MLKKIVLILLTLFISIMVLSEEKETILKILPDEIRAGDWFGSDIILDNKIGLITTGPNSDEQYEKVFIVDLKENKITQVISNSSIQFFGRNICMNKDFIFWGGKEKETGKLLIITNKIVDNKINYYTKTLYKPKLPNLFDSLDCSMDYIVATEILEGATIYEINNGNLKLMQKIKPPSDDSQSFGELCKIDADEIYVNMSGSGYQFDYFGKIYRYGKNKKGNWELVQTIVSLSDSDKRFGKSFFISNNTMVVLSVGALHIFTRNENNMWMQVQRIAVPEIKRIPSKAVAMNEESIFVMDIDLDKLMKYRKNNGQWSFEKSIDVPNITKIDMVDNILLAGAHVDNANGKFAGAAYIIKLTE